MKIAACGNVCMDITPAFSEGKSDNAFMPGTMVTVGAADVHTGGSVANTGLALKVFGTEVKLIAKIGKDAFGEKIMDIFAAHNADKNIIVDENLSTAYSIIMAPPKTDRIIFHNTGANDYFYCDDITDEDLEGIDLLHFGYPPLMKGMYQNGGSELIKLFKRLKEKGIETSLDMAYVDDNSPADKEDWEQILKNVLPYTDIFVPSAEEILKMAERETFNRIRNIAGNGDFIDFIDIGADILPLAQKLNSWGARRVIIKCGARGMLYLDKEITYFTHCYRPEKYLSSTGAGDVSIAGFLAAYSKGLPIRTCVDCAAAAGAQSLGSYNALGNLTNFEMLFEKMKSWEKVQR